MNGVEKSLSNCCGLVWSVIRLAELSKCADYFITVLFELLCVFPFFCIFFLSVLLLLPFASFAVLLNCPYPDPRVLPFPSHSPLHPSGGRGDRAAMWSFVAGQGQTPLQTQTEHEPGVCPGCRDSQQHSGQPSAGKSWSNWSKLSRRLPS